MEMLLLMTLLVIFYPFIFIWRLVTGDKYMPPRDRIIALGLVLFLSSFASAGSHQRLVAQSGIRPNQVGRYEGVGMSTRSYTDARNNACYWGRKTPISIQYSKRGNRYYAVVRYK